MIPPVTVIGVTHSRYVYISVRMPSYGQLFSGKKPTSGIGYHDRGSRPLTL